MSTNGEKQFEAAPFQVQLELFDGPIDLLLHLVKKNELAIERIALAKVATQYMECVERMRSMNLDMVAEYLVIAATLLSVKSSVLLNEPVELVVDEEGNLVDPHKVLLERLREAQVYREGASSLAQRKLLGQDVFSGPSHLKRVPAPPTPVSYTHLTLPTT